ncbi:MAG: hypothetical protein HY291_15530 [Planctomycetes bacterium]|nr:hypothetical protein [Planctomycetota bacterium]
MKTLMVLLAIITLAARSYAADAPAAKPKNRLVRVVTVTQDRLPPLPADKLFEATLDYLDRSAGFHPDIACLPEHCSGRDAESVPGPSTEKVSTWAKAHNCYVICPLTVKDGEKNYNAAVLIDRKGEIVGQYRKIHPTEGEMEKGIAPGPEDPSVFKTDFGTIGIQICFDANWADGWNKLKEKGAEIVFWPSAYPAARLLQAYAWQHRYFVVSSTNDRPSTIYDLSGEPITTTGRFQPWAGALIPLDKQLFEIDFHTKKMRDIQVKYGDKVQVQWFHNEDWVTLASLDPDLTMAELIEEYKLLPIKDYHARCEKAQQAMRSGADAAKPKQDGK